MKRSLTLANYSLLVYLVVAHIAIILFSWIVSSVAPSLPIRSVLSGEGMRWLFGSFTDNVSHPLLVWLLLGGMAYGVFSYSGLKDALCRMRDKRDVSFRQRHALYAAVVVFALSVCAVALLALPPHAALLGVSGRLFPGPFSEGLFPVTALIVIAASLTYGMSSGQLTGKNSLPKSLSAGIIALSSWLPVYFLAMQLYHLILFVFK